METSEAQNMRPYHIRNRQTAEDQRTEAKHVMKMKQDLLLEAVHFRIFYEGIDVFIIIPGLSDLGC